MRHHYMTTQRKLTHFGYWGFYMLAYGVWVGTCPLLIRQLHLNSVYVYVWNLGSFHSSWFSYWSFKKCLVLVIPLPCPTTPYSLNLLCSITCFFSFISLYSISLSLSQRFPSSSILLSSLLWVFQVKPIYLQILNCIHT